MTVELASYLRIVRRHWLVSALFGLAGLGVGLLLTLAIPTGYQATAGVFAPATPTYLTLDVETSTESPTQAPREWTQDTESELLHSEVVLRAAAARLGGTWTVDELVDRIQVSVPTSTRVFSITVTASDATQAQRAASVVAEEYVSRRSRLLADRAERVSAALRARRASLSEILSKAPAETTDSASTASPFPVDATLRAQIRGQIARIDEALATDAGTSANAAELVTPPQRPRLPTHANAEVPPVSGLMAGLLAGLGLGYVRERRHPYVRTLDDVTDSTDAPVAARLDGGLLQTPTSARTQEELGRLAAELRGAVVGSRAVPARVLVTGCCAESLILAFADQLRLSFDTGRASAADGEGYDDGDYDDAAYEGTAYDHAAYAREADDLDPEHSERGMDDDHSSRGGPDDIDDVTVVAGRAGSAGTLRRARTADAVLVLAELGSTAR
ncbi:MAG TPA: hypothetical protein VE287_09575, partial [Actinopolymorphaceae bacterium]|nr:hypothetical protein [Actinopolymorphaceae bacterium]